MQGATAPLLQNNTARNLAYHLKPTENSIVVISRATGLPDKRNYYTYMLRWRGHEATEERDLSKLAD